MPTHGVAIPIPEPWAEELARVRSEVGDPLAELIPPHVTLLPPTAVPRAMVSSFVAHLGLVAAAGSPFEMVLSGTASFRPISPVVFVQVSEGISSCEQLERAVRSGPVERPLEFNYHPHVTIAHHVPDEALDLAVARCADFRSSFEVTGFELFEQGRDGVWRPQQHFALGGSR
ncbi:MAG TPA: 2'-5' RNA ligase family protein [Phycicoccus sp.]|jgi:2'-5' RNA ligase|nr:2'-5' RNA ligase family protein [Phycicoccus sp.]HQY97122.1 2'-5' RNA ligase family protein [Phycicoccus sp.]HRA44949.1 2'-5' RNA ligase family protein [Phycicoccus sp.]